MAKKYLDDTGMSYFWGKLKAYFQEKLVSGTNIKTINNESLLGSGDISVASTVVEDFTSQIATTHTKGSIFSGLKVGKVCNITVQLTLTSAVNAWGTLATIPAGYRPYEQQKHLSEGIDITKGGNIRSTTARTSGSNVELSFCYICQ